jgi:hypothetical protein
MNKKTYKLYTERVICIVLMSLLVLLGRLYSCCVILLNLNATGKWELGALLNEHHGDHGLIHW